MRHGDPQITRPPKGPWLLLQQLFIVTFQTSKKIMK